MLKQVSLF